LLEDPRGDSLAAPAPEAGGPFHRVDPPDASVPPLDAGTYSSADLIAHCPASNRDVLYVNAGDTVSPGWGSYAPGPATYTNLDSNWTMESPFKLFVHRVSGEGDTLDVATADGRPLAPGHYALGSASAPSLKLGGDFGIACASPLSGTLDVLDSQPGTDDAGAPLPSAALLAFDVRCESGGASVPVQGCVRYAQSPSYDGGAPAIAADAGAGLLAPCASGGNVYWVEGTSPRPKGITGAIGTWSVGINEGPLLQFGTTLWPLWELGFAADSFAPGTYTLSGSEAFNPNIVVNADGTGCGPTSTGTVTIAEIQTAPTTGAPDVDVTRLLMGFDLKCGGVPVRGCVSFGGR
jgi:hypothetical protein